jgi:hypothetical protein
MKIRNILIVEGSDMLSYHNAELLAHLTDCQDIKFGDTLNFSTNTRFEGTGSRAVEAFNIYLRFLSKSVERIIINL